MYLGMNLARRQGITYLHLESDYEVLNDMIAKRVKLNGNTVTLCASNYSLDSFDIHDLESPHSKLQSILI
jgi:hypothetical protein